MDGSRHLSFGADASWIWLPWAAVLVLGVLLGEVLFRERAGKRWAGLCGASLGILIVVHTFRTRDISGYLLCLAVLVVCSGRWLLGSYLRARKATGVPGVQAFAMRSGALIVAVLLVIRPTWVHLVVEVRKPTLVIALDESRSMELAGKEAAGTGNTAGSRRETLRRGLEANLDLLRRLEEVYRVEKYGFGQWAYREGAAPGEGDPAGFTALGDSLMAIADQQSGPSERLTGILLMSDGRSNLSVRYDPMAAARDLSRRGVALWATGVGQPQQEGDAGSLVGRDLRFPRRVSGVTRVPVDAEFLATGLAGKDVHVDLYMNGQLVESRAQRVKASRDNVEVRFDLSAPREGTHQLTVKAHAKGSKALDELTDYLQVEEGRMSVLALDRPRVEDGHLLRSLGLSQELQVDRRFVRGTSAESLEGLLRDSPVEWERYDVVVLGDIDLSGNWPGQKKLYELVTKEGLGLIVLGGRLSLDPKRPLPVVLQDLLPIRVDGIRQADQAIRVRPTTAGQDHEVCSVSDDRDTSVTLWEALPELEGAYTFGDRKPAAESLLVTLDDQPVLVAHQTGKGRVAILGLDQTWKWSLASEVGGQVHRRFWRQLIVWLANRQPHMQVAIERAMYDLGKIRAGEEEVRIAVHMRGVADSGGDEPSAPKVSIKEPSGQTQTVRPVKEADRYTANLRPAEAGEYSVTAEAFVKGKPLQSNTARFVVQKRDVELSDRRPDHDLLRRMAEATRTNRGAYADFAQLGALLEEIREAAHPERIERESQESLVEEWKWWLYGILIGLVVAEWVVRRRAGTV